MDHWVYLHTSTSTFTCINTLPRVQLCSCYIFILLITYCIVYLTLYTLLYKHLYTMHTYIHLLYIPIYYIIVHIIQHCIHRHMHTHIPYHWILCLYSKLQIWPYTRTVRGQKYLVKYGLFASWITPYQSTQTQSSLCGHSLSSCHYMLLCSDFWLLPNSCSLLFNKTSTWLPHSFANLDAQWFGSWIACYVTKKNGSTVIIIHYLKTVITFPELGDVNLTKPTVTFSKKTWTIIKLDFSLVR